MHWDPSEILRHLGLGGSAAGGAGGAAGFTALKWLFRARDPHTVPPCHRDYHREKHGWPWDKWVVTHVTANGRFTIRMLEG